MKCCLKPSKKSVISKIRDKQNRDKQGLPVVRPDLYGAPCRLASWGWRFETPLTVDKFFGEKINITFNKSIIWV